MTSPQITNKVYKVVFDFVDPVEHPEYYRDALPVVAAADVPDEHWKRTERADEKGAVLVQYLGLRKLVELGELIREVRFYEGTINRIEWREIQR